MIDPPTGSSYSTIIFYPILCAKIVLGLEMNTEESHNGYPQGAHMTGVQTCKPITAINFISVQLDVCTSLGGTMSSIP